MHAHFRKGPVGLNVSGRSTRAGKVLFWLLPLLVAAIGLAMQQPTALNHDVAWVLDSSRRLLHGGEFGVDVVDSNPPLIWWISSIPMFVAEGLGVAPIPLFRVFVALLALCSMFMTERLLRPRFPAVARGWIMLTLAFVLFIPTIIISRETLFHDAPAYDYWLLILSGILGIAIADALFLKGLNLLGAGLQAIISCMYSPSIISLSMLWLGEKMSVMQIIGTTLIISAVLTAISKRSNAHISRRNLALGLALGISAHIISGVGIVMIKTLLERSPLLWVTEIRLLGGVVAGFVILLLFPNRRKIIKSLTSAGSWGYTISGSFIGAYLAMLFWIAGMKFTQTSIAAALNQSNNIFIFILAAWFLKEPINRRRVVGIILAAAGSLLVTFA